jgi:hypothetical protein
MAGCGGKDGAGSLYAALGVASDCSDAELRSAYRKLAMVRASVLCFPPLLNSSVSWLTWFWWAEMAPGQVRRRRQLRRRGGRKGQVPEDPGSLRR